MPPVRWKILIQIVQILLLLQMTKCDSLHDPISSMGSNGWRPIVGKSQRDVNDEITLYKNPSGNDPDSKLIKAQTISYHTPAPTQPTKLYQTISTSEPGATILPSSRKGSIKNGKKIQVVLGSKSPSHVKIQQPIVLIPKFPILGHGPHIPLTSSRRLPIVNVHQNSKRKPMRGAQSLKNEIFIPASSSGLGAYSFFAQSHGPTRMRDSPNFPSSKHIHFLQPQYANQFGVTGTSGSNDVVIQQVPVRTLLIQNKYPNPNDGNRFKNDEYTKNLVPPPYSFIHQDSKPTDYSLDDINPTDFVQKEHVKPTDSKQHEHADSHDDPINNSLHLVVGKYKDHRNQPEKNVALGPPLFEDKPKFNSYHSQLNDEEVHVTKEKLKTYHTNIPLTFKYEEDDDSFDFPTKKLPTDKSKSPIAESYAHINNYNSDIKPPRSRIPIRESFLVFDEPKRERIRKPSSSNPSFATYEVTEGKQWQVFQPFLTTKPSQLHNPVSSQYTPTLPQQQIEHTAFLPTPYHPDNSVPTSPTQDEISSIYTELNKKHNFKHDHYPDDQDFFNIREVSTHYPIINKIEFPTANPVPVNTENTEYNNDVSTGRPEKRKTTPRPEPEEEPETPKPSRKPPGNRNRNPSRRRKPQFAKTTSTTTTTTTTTTEEPHIQTEAYDSQRDDQLEENYETPKPRRTRKPTRIRTTEATVLETTTKNDYITVPPENIRPKYKVRYEGNRIKPLPIEDNIEEIPINHKLEEEQHSVEFEPNYEYKTEPIESFNLRPTTEDLPTYENDVLRNEQASVNTIPTEDVLRVSQNFKLKPVEPEEPLRYTQEQPQSFTDSFVIQEVSTTSQPPPTPSPSRRRHRFSTTTTEYPVTVNIVTPENEIEIDYSTHSSRYDPPRETTTAEQEYRRVPGILKVRSSTSTTTTTPSTTTETTTKSNRVRGRPVNKYESKNRPRFSVKEYRERLNQHSSTTTTTDLPRTSSESSRIRFPNRSRKPIVNQDNETTTERSKFTPKEPRHNTINSEAASTERKIHTRARPLINRRATTEASVTQKVSIKPNIFSNLRRPTPASLKLRILNKYNRTEERGDKSQPTETTQLPNNENELIDKKDVDLEEESEELRNDGFLLSQRISNLTSSAQNDYDTPGLFKAVSPNTRKVPSYFTISTDDPILPIEAFFPNIKEKINRSDNDN